MEIRKTSLYAIQDAARAVGLQVAAFAINQRGDGFNVKLKLGRPNNAKDPAPYGRRSYDGGRRINAVCWHGFRDFLRALLTAQPDAKVRTAWARYDGLAGFEAGFRATGARNIGSQARPCRADQACDCGHEIETGTLRPGGGVANVRMIRQSAVVACPFFILDPSHYGPSGSCLCDSAAERARMVREWGYKPTSWANPPAVA